MKALIFLTLLAVAGSAQAVERSGDAYLVTRDGLYLMQSTGSGAPADRLTVTPLPKIEIVHGPAAIRVLVRFKDFSFSEKEMAPLRRHLSLAVDTWLPKTERECGLRKSHPQAGKVRILRSARNWSRDDIEVRGQRVAVGSASAEVCEFTVPGRAAVSPCDVLDVFPPIELKIHERRELKLAPLVAELALKLDAAHEAPLEEAEKLIRTAARGAIPAPEAKEMARALAALCREREPVCQKKVPAGALPENFLRSETYALPPVTEAVKMKMAQAVCPGL